MFPTSYAAFDPASNFLLPDDFGFGEHAFFEVDNPLMTLNQNPSLTHSIIDNGHRESDASTLLGPSAASTYDETLKEVCVDSIHNHRFADSMNKRESGCKRASGLTILLDRIKLSVTHNKQSNSFKTASLPNTQLSKLKADRRTAVLKLGQTL